MTKLYVVPTHGDYRVHFAWLAKIYMQPHHVQYSVVEQHIIMNVTIIGFQNATKFNYTGMDITYVYTSFYGFILEWTLLV